MFYDSPFSIFNLHHCLSYSFLREIWQPLYKIAFRMTKQTTEDFLYRFLQMLSFNSHSHRNKIVHYFALVEKNKSKQWLLP